MFLNTRDNVFFSFNLLGNHLLQSQMGIDIRSHQVFYCKFLRLNKGQKGNSLSQFHKMSLYQRESIGFEEQFYH